MSPNLHKILIALAKELTSEVAKKVTDQLRVSLVGDITAIVKECLNNDELYKSSATGVWITIQDCATKYHTSRKTINNKCTLFNVSRKWIGRHNLLNEQEFLNAHDRPMGKPDFLKRQKAA